MNCPDLRWTIHALQRMFKRSISHADVLEVLGSGTVVEVYADDLPLPSRLLLHSVRGRPLHVVVAGGDDTECVVVTVYEPDNIRWLDDFRTRRPG